MSKFENLSTHVVVSVDDSKDDRFAGGWKVFGSSSPKSDTPDKSWKVADLKAYADENGVDLGEATKKDDILAAIAAPKPAEKPADETSDDSAE